MSAEDTGNGDGTGFGSPSLSSWGSISNPNYGVGTGTQTQPGFTTPPNYNPSGGYNAGTNTPNYTFNNSDTSNTGPTNNVTGAGFDLSKLYNGAGSSSGNNPYGLSAGTGDAASPGWGAAFTGNFGDGPGQSTDTGTKQYSPEELAQKGLPSWYNNVNPGWRESLFNATNPSAGGMMQTLGIRGMGSTMNDVSAQEAVNPGMQDARMSAVGNIAGTAVNGLIKAAMPAAISIPMAAYNAYQKWDGTKSLGDNLSAIAGSPGSALSQGLQFAGVNPLASQALGMGTDAATGRDITNPALTLAGGTIGSYLGGANGGGPVGSFIGNQLGSGAGRMIAASYNPSQGGSPSPSSSDTNPSQTASTPQGTQVASTLPSDIHDTLTGLGVNVPSSGAAPGASFTPQSLPQQNAGGGFDLASLVGAYGAYRNGNNVIDNANSNQAAINNQISQLSNMYGPNSPYAQQLRASLAAKDAAAGRNSQYGTREVQLQAMLADKAAQTAGTIGTLAGQGQQSANAASQAQAQQWAALANMADKTGATQWATNGLKGMWNNMTGNGYTQANPATNYTLQTGLQYGPQQSPQDYQASQPSDQPIWNT